MKFPTMDEFAQMVADKAMDEVEYNGKTIREWIEIIASNDGDTISRKAAKDALNHEMRCGAVINQCGLEMAYEIIEDLPSAELGTNLASLGTDCISRQAAVDALAELARERFTIQDCFQIYLDALTDADKKIQQLPPAQPERKRAKWIATTSLQEGQIT